MNRLGPLRAGKPSAFTLVELLVVIVLIAITTALLLPVVNKVRSSGLSAKCAQQQRTIYMALLAFAEDHQGLMPPALGVTSGSSQTKDIHSDFNVNQYWYDTAYLGRYVLNQPDRNRWAGGILKDEELRPFQCPAHRDPDKISYVMQRVPFDRQKYSLRAMQDRASNLFITEGLHTLVNKVSALSDPPDSMSTARRLRRFHDGGLNILFFDGHVERFTGADEEIEKMFKLQSD